MQPVGVDVELEKVHVCNYPKKENVRQGWRRTDRWCAANGWRASTLKWEDPDPIKNGWLAYWPQVIMTLSPGSPSLSLESQPASGHAEKEDNERPSAMNIPDNASKKYERFEARYQELSSYLCSIAAKIDAIRTDNTKQAGIKKNLLAFLETYIKDSMNKLGEIKTGARWDKLVIAFFGETNAGKSTIIETFRILFDESRNRAEKEGDGLIVGDGRSDFTKVYEEYNLKINGKEFILIDVPGIEGREEDFRDEIKRALNQAHCVFYVQGHNKKPDIKTAEKIKNYLSDWVNVYSIFNVRGGASNYDESDERETLETEAVRKNEQLIQDTFRGILGNIYKGNITLQALLAMCARGHFSSTREDLLRAQKKLLGYFGSADAVLRFSRFDRIMQLVDEKSEHYTDEIVEANKQKLIAQYRKVYQGLVDMIAEQQRDIDRLKERLIRFDVDMNMSFEETIRAIRNRMAYEHTKVFDDFKREVCDVLDDDYNREDSEKEIQQRAERLFEAYTMESKIIVEYEFSRLEEKIRERRRELDNIQIGGLHIDISSLEMPNLDEAFGKMNLNFGDVFGFATTVGGTALAFSVIPGFGTLIGAGVGLLLWGGKQLFLGDGKREEAKDKARKRIDEKKRESQSTSLNKQINLIERTLDNEKDRFRQIIRNERSNLQQLSGAIEDAQRQVVAYANHIKNTAYGEI
ncbi:hypothetical protein T231_14230 [Tannerella sp. oral taxon BU063 isolate Cell 6/7/9]|uniref:G domain-containing protein n=1 Tax=Tannerella sp. oral taxon BU063 isolate Cell 6/7/9 TaxID=1411021 RepID=W2CLY7_9BACT|nr:hypothetical protein T231_14230 [Tannerella sp. oral taxon BU063 isolate Cell 6/7/9]